VKEFGLDANHKSEVIIPTPPHRDIVLDAWRGISVLLVIFYHMVVFRFAPTFREAVEGSPQLSPFSGSAIVGFLKHQAVREFSYAGPLGVQIFFVISGYIITKLLLREHQRNGRVSLLAFYARRAFRILPALWLMLGVTLALSLLGYIHVAPKSFLMAASFTCNTQPTSCGWFAGHTWSVATEEQFYLFWPLLLTLLGFRSVARAALVICILFIAADQFSLLTVAFIHNALSGACVAAGALFASSETLRTLVSRARFPLVLGAACLLFGKPFLQDHVYGLSAVTAAITPFLIIIVIFSCSRYRARLENVMAIRALSAIGLVSYGLYLWQEMFLGEASNYLSHSFLDYTPLCALIVLLSYFLVEVPLMRVGARVSRKLIAQAKARSTTPITVESQASILTTNDAV
jgi:peptidoglycan/LPS O-acetylase OafA/YrhL